MKEAGIDPAQGITFTIQRKMEMAQLMQGRMREGTHDDRLWALALAVYAAEAERASRMVVRVR